MYYFRNKLNARNVKGKVRNSYRAHKYLYYTVLDVLCCVMFLDEFEIVNFDDVIPLPNGSIHLIALTEGILSDEQRVRLTANRFINLQGGVNNNMALDE